jgi:glycosyltransferase involved in cell wall biosynthesis
MRKLCVFPNDPIISYYKKGEIKTRYYNPTNFFDEVHIISLIEKDINESEVQNISGNAKLKIHSIGKINIKNYSKYTKQIIELIKSINPDVIRAYNPLVEGWLAAVSAKELKIPFFLSLHTQYDQKRKIAKKNNLKKFLVLKYTEKFIEPYVLKTATHITIVHKIIEPYVLKHGGKKPDILYNKIDYERLSNGIPIKSLPQPLIISVGNLIKEKNHQCLIEAMKNVNAYLLIIGNGKLYQSLQNLILQNKLEKKVFIIKSVPNNEIQNFYKSAQVFALAYDPELEGLPIPVIEAMATGLSIVIPYPKIQYSDGLEDVVIFSKRDPISFSQNISKVLNDSKLQAKLSLAGQKKARDFDNIIIEKREAQIYSKLVEKL